MSTRGECPTAASLSTFGVLVYGADCLLGGEQISGTTEMRCRWSGQGLLSLWCRMSVADCAVAISGLVEMLVPRFFPPSFVDQTLPLCCVPTAFCGSGTAFAMFYCLCG